MKGFIHNGTLQKHIRTHTGDAPYKCDICSKGFIHNGNLQAHIRTHTGDKPYKCDICGKGFSQNGGLQTHIRTHTGSRIPTKHFTTYITFIRFNTCMCYNV
jgi:KRAB domain-containing zinc finger protein